MPQQAWLAEWEAAFVRCGLPVAGLDDPRPRARFAIAAPLAPTMPAERELIDLWLTDRLPRWRVRDALAGRLPEGHALVDLYDVWLGETPLAGQVSASVYRATLAGPGVDAGRVAVAAMALLAAPTLPRERERGERIVVFDLRPFVEALDVSDADSGPVVVRMTLRHDPERGVGRPADVLAELSGRLGIPLEPPVLESLVRERLVLSSDRAAPRQLALGS